MRFPILHSLSNFRLIYHDLNECPEKVLYQKDLICRKKEIALRRFTFPFFVYRSREVLVYLFPSDKFTRIHSTLSLHFVSGLIETEGIKHCSSSNPIHKSFCLLSIELLEYYTLLFTCSIVNSGCHRR